MIDIEELKQAIRALEHAQTNTGLSEAAAFNLPVYKQALQALDLKAERDALAAENLALKELYQGAVKELDDTCFEIGMMRGEKSMEHPAPDTPATDAYTNQLRAEGVAMLRDEFKKHDEQFKVRCDWFISQLLRTPTAVNLRKENGNG